ncbi:hypothetical protein [Bacillus sp. OK048]|nr:hypothetical protein [Bacillus sp. OK048]SDM37226.1 hypothetical protein SAMN05443253_10392 [Bacillus sp. OK048]
MSKKKRPLISNVFLDELAKEINQLNGVPEEKNEDNMNDEKEK